MASAQCSYRGALVSGTCQCVVMWHGPTCAEPFADQVGHVAWSVFALFGACTNALLFAFMALCLAHKFLPCHGNRVSPVPGSDGKHETGTGTGHSGSHRGSTASELGAEGRGCRARCCPCRHGNARDASMLANMVACGLRMGFFASPLGYGRLWHRGECCCARGATVTLLPSVLSPCTGSLAYWMWSQRRCCFACRRSAVCPLARPLGVRRVPS